MCIRDRLDKLQFNTREENQAESFRKMLLAMARDVRVILILSLIHI